MEKFNPKAHMRVFERRQRQPDGSYQTVRVDYLDVKWRLVWFRQEHPDGSIITDLLSPPGVSPAVVKARVSYLDEGGAEVVTTGMGQCGQDEWSDWLAKAETQAIGRALAAIGYGTQFCEDFEDVVTAAPAPAPPQGGQRDSRTAPQRQKAKSGPGGETGEMMTANQRKYLFSLAREAGVAVDKLERITKERFGGGVDMLLKNEASALIGLLQELREERLQAESPGPSATYAEGWDFRDNTAGMAEAEPAGVTEKQLQALEDLRKRQSMEAADLLAFACDYLKRDIASLRHLTEAEAGELIKAVGAI